MKFALFPLLTLLVAAPVALAHQGVKDPGVMARMNGMTAVGNAMEMLKSMAGAKVAFNSTTATAAKADLIRHLKAAPALFEEPHTDPKTEALPIIWDDFGAFTKVNDAAIAAATGLNAETLDGLRATLPSAGQGCVDCHKVYRKKKP